MSAHDHRRPRDLHWLEAPTPRDRDARACALAGVALFWLVLLVLLALHLAGG